MENAERRGVEVNVLGRTAEAFFQPRAYSPFSNPYLGFVQLQVGGG
jgi:hypothetical protein